MSATLESLADVITGARDLFDEIARLRAAGDDGKTAALEAAALALVARLERALEAAQAEDSAGDEELRAALEAEEAALTTYLETADLSLAEAMSARSRLADVKFKLGSLTLGATFTWKRLLSAAELEMYRQAVSQAAAEVRRRRLLGSVLRSLFGVLNTATSLLSKILAL